MPGKYGRGHSHNPELTDLTRMRVLVVRTDTRPATPARSMQVQCHLDGRFCTCFVRLGAPRGPSELGRKTSR